METMISVPVLLADFSRWLTFMTASRKIIRQYDRQLSQIGRQRADLSDLSDYLRACLHHRNQFFGHLALQLTGRVAQLRTGPVNEPFIRQLTHAHPVMQVLIGQLMVSFAEIEDAYRTLTPVGRVTQVSSSWVIQHRPRATA